MMMMISVIIMMILLHQVGISLGGIILGHYLVKEGDAAKVEAALLVSGKLASFARLQGKCFSQKNVSSLLWHLRGLQQLGGWLVEQVAEQVVTNSDFQPEKNFASTQAPDKVTCGLNCQSEATIWEKSTLWHGGGVLQHHHQRVWHQVRRVSSTIQCSVNLSQVHSPHVWLQLLARILWSSQAGWQIDQY